MKKNLVDFNAAFALLDLSDNSSNSYAVLRVSGKTCSVCVVGLLLLCLDEKRREIPRPWTFVHRQFVAALWPPSRRSWTAVYADSVMLKEIGLK